MNSGADASVFAFVESVLQKQNSSPTFTPKTADEFYTAVRHSILANAICIDDLHYAFHMEDLTITKLSSALYKGPDPVRDITDALWDKGGGFRLLGRKAGHAELGLKSSLGKGKGYLPSDQAIAFVRQCASQLASKRRRANNAASGM